jgi:hypothetical protein
MGNKNLIFVVLLNLLLIDQYWKIRKDTILIGTTKTSDCVSHGCNRRDTGGDGGGLDGDSGCEGGDCEGIGSGGGEGGDCGGGGIVFE